MLLEITTTAPPATDLGYLLAKNPATVRAFDLSFGRAHAFFPQATDDRCTFALLLDVDPVALVRGRVGARRDAGVSEEAYVNDRPYVASSFLSVAISEVLGSALAGRSRERPELAATAIPLAAHVTSLPCRGGGAALVERLFAPLGWRVTAETMPLDATQPAWGEAPYVDLRLEGTARLADLLAHLYVLVPVLDDRKHYFVSDDEVEKLLRRGEGWLAAHPERELIAQRYLRHRRSLARAALARLTADEGDDPDEQAVVRADAETALERPIRLDDARRDAVAEALRASGARRVLDLGCGEGRLLRALLRDGKFERIVGVDVSQRALEAAARRLRVDEMSPAARERVQLLHGALTYRDARLAGFDAAACVEVVEHLDPARLAAFERVVFEFARPGTVVVTTPNREHNVLFPTLAAGAFRHADHRFEWTRDEFRAWAGGVAERHGYAVTFRPVGAEDAVHGPPTQMAVFVRGAA